MTADKFVFKVKIGLLYSRNDVWVQPRDEGFRIGLTDFSQRRGGDIIFVEYITPSGRVREGEEVARYETIKLVQSVESPVDGEITRVNPSLESKPELVNEDPYGEGWIAELRPVDFDSSRLLTAEEYMELMKTKVSEELWKIKGI